MISKRTSFTTPVKYPTGAMIEMFAEGITSWEWDGYARSIGTRTHTDCDLSLPKKLRTILRIVVIR